MAIYNQSNTVAFRAAAALAQYSCVYQSSGAYVSSAVLSSTPGIGFAQQAATAADDIIEVAYDKGNETYAIAGTSGISVNAELMCSTGSRVIAATSGSHICAIAREAATAAGDIIRVQIAEYMKP